MRIRVIKYRDWAWPHLGKPNSLGYGHVLIHFDFGKYAIRLERNEVAL